MIALGAFLYIVNVYYTISGQQQTNTKILMIEFKKQSIMNFITHHNY
jgi:hypothetical protein